jgi:hypothetical protein
MCKLVCWLLIYEENIPIFILYIGRDGGKDKRREKKCWRAKADVQENALYVS